MTLGNTAILMAIILILFGFGHQTLASMKLSKRLALAWLAAMMLGSFIDLQVSSRPLLLLNLGGSVVPLAYSAYLIAADENRSEKLRSVASVLVTGLTGYSAGKIMPDEPGVFWLVDPVYLYAVVGAMTAYLAGRSGRAAFSAASAGAVLADLARFTEGYLAGLYRGRIWIGGSGAFDTIVLSGAMALFLVELVGEKRGSTV